MAKEEYKVISFSKILEWPKFFSTVKCKREKIEASLTMALNHYSTEGWELVSTFSPGLGESFAIFRTRGTDTNGTDSNKKNTRGTDTNGFPGTHF